LQPSEALLGHVLPEAALQAVSLVTDWGFSEAAPVAALLHVVRLAAAMIVSAKAAAALLVVVQLAAGEPEHLYPVLLSVAAGSAGVIAFGLSAVQALVAVTHAAAVCVDLFPVAAVTVVAPTVARLLVVEMRFAVVADRTVPLFEIPAVVEVFAVLVVGFPAISDMSDEIA